MTLVVLRLLIICVGIFGIVVSVSAYLATLLKNTVAWRLVRLTEQVVLVATLSILLMFMTGFLGWDVSLGHLFDSLAEMCGARSHAAEPDQDSGSSLDRDRPSVTNGAEPSSQP
jgi:hypothetical protein